MSTYLACSARPQKFERISNLWLPYDGVLAVRGIGIYKNWVHSRKRGVVHVFREMEDPARLRREYPLAVLQHQHDLIDLTAYQLRAKRAWRGRYKQRRNHWVRPWIGRRRQFGMYDQL